MLIRLRRMNTGNPPPPKKRLSIWFWKLKRKLELCGVQSEVVLRVLRYPCPR